MPAGDRTLFDIAPDFNATPPVVTVTVREPLCLLCGEEETARGGDIHCSGDCDDASHDEPGGCHRFVAVREFCPSCGHYEPHAPRTANLSSGRCAEPDCLCLSGWRPKGERCA